MPDLVPVPAPAPGPLNPSRVKAEGRMAAVADGSLAAALRAQARSAADPNAAALAGGLADLAAGGLTSLAPALPLLLALRDEPFSLAQRPMYETLYRTVLVPPSEFLMFGRQTGKSTLQASRMILDAAVIHDFNALYLTPLFEMTRRFSSNYVGSLLRDSPVRHLLVDPRASDSVLQKTFLTRANLFFSYASTDAERTRGLPIDCVYLDESFCGETTAVRTGRGLVPIKDVLVGDRVESFDRSGRLTTDRVTAVEYHGYRHCFRLTAADGRSLTLTAESWLGTTEDWKRLSDLVGLADATGAGHPAGRRVDELLPEHPCREVHIPARVGATRVQLSEIPDIVRVRSHATRETEEQRLRDVVERLGDHLPPLPLVLSRPVLPDGGDRAAGQIGQPALAGRDDRGSPGVVVGGRRVGGGQDDAVDHLSHRRVSRRRGRTAVGLAGETVGDRQPRGRGQEVPDRPAPPGRGRPVSRTDRPADATGGPVQVAAGPPVVDRVLCGVQPRVPAGPVDLRGDTRSQAASALLSGSGVSARTPSTDQRPVPHARAAGGDCGRSPGTGVHRRGPGEGCREDASEAGGDDAGGEGHTPGGQAGEAGGGHGRPAAAEGHLRDVRGGVRDQSAGENPLLRSGLQGGRGQGEQGEVRLAATAVVRIEYVGQRHVWDLTTETHQAFLANDLAVHNCQNIRYDLISLITQTMGGSPWRRRRISGTPKSLANTAEAVWQATSQAEWFIKCRAGGCGHWNIPALEYDLLAMIGPWHRDISPRCPALLCGKCRKPVNTRAGRWVHRHPARKLSFAGHHLPQTVIPDTCESADAWATLTAAQKGAENMSHARFLNEVCAVSFDEASRLVTLTDVRKASVLPWPNALKPALAAARAAAGKYRLKVVAVDWGGGGGVPDPLLAAGRPRTSWTVMTVLGLDEAHAAVDVLYAHKSTQTHDPLFEARQAAYLFGTFGSEYLVHDFSNAGNQQEIFLRQAGVAGDRILGFRYNPPQSREMMTYQKPTVEQPRGHYKLVKSTSLGFVTQALRMGFVRLPQSDLDDNTRPSPFRDLLALTEERVESRLGADYYVIGRDPNLSDDFAQALNIGAHALWFAWRAAGGAGWPDLALAAKFRYSDAQIEALDGAVDLAVFT